MLRNYLPNRLRDLTPWPRQTGRHRPCPPQEGLNSPKVIAAAPRAPSRRHRKGREGPAICLSRPPQPQTRLSRPWIQRINAGARQTRPDLCPVHERHEEGRIELDRKVLSDLAAREPEAFKSLVEQAGKRSRPDGLWRKEGRWRGLKARGVLALVFMIALTLSACGGSDRDISEVKRSNARTGIADGTGTPDRRCARQNRLVGRAPGEYKDNEPSSWCAAIVDRVCCSGAKHQVMMD